MCMTDLVNPLLFYVFILYKGRGGSTIIIKKNLKP